LTTLPALVAPAGSRRSPKGSGSARETGDHVDTNGGSAGRQAGEAENEYDEVGRGEVEGEEVAGPTLAELEAEEIGGDEDAKERESPGRRKVGLQANLRRLSVRLTNVPNIFRCLSCVMRVCAVVRVRARLCCVVCGARAHRVLFASVNLRVSSRCGRKRKALW
jgi:hypothetical protein